MFIWYVLSLRAVPISSLNKPHPSLKNDGHLNFIAGWVQRMTGHFPRFWNHRHTLCFAMTTSYAYRHGWVQGNDPSHFQPVPNRDPSRQLTFFPWLGDRCFRAANFFFPGLGDRCYHRHFLILSEQPPPKGQEWHTFNITNLLLWSSLKTPWKQKVAGVVTCSCSWQSPPLLCQTYLLLPQLFLGCEIS